MKIKTSQQIKNKLLEIATDLKLIVSKEEVVSNEIGWRDYLSFHEALKEVESAITALEKIDPLKLKVDKATIPPKAQKSFMQKLSEI